MNLPLDSPLSSASKDDKPERQLSMRALLTTAQELKRQGQIVTPYYVEYQRSSSPWSASRSASARSEEGGRWR